MDLVLVARLRALILAVWAAMHPSLAHVGDADAIASGIAQAVVEDGARAPVYSSHAEDAAVAAVYAAHESNLNAAATHDPVSERDHPSFGPWQLGVEWRSRSVHDQARAWLYLLREGARICPESPAAPLSGGCSEARHLASRREREARALLVEALQD